MKENSASGETETGFISHLIELRSRLLFVVAGISVVTLSLLPFANELYTYLATPLIKNLPEGTSMIAVDVATSFLIPFKFVMLLAVFITIPFTLYHAWAFIAPGLYKREKILIAPLLISSTALFYAGVAFAYYIVFPLVFAFLIKVAPEGISVTPDIARYLSFAMTLFLAFGVAFETPIAIVLLVITGITTPEALADKRRYVIVAAFVIGMLLTPPDVISQVMLAIPIWILYESGLIASRMVLRRRATDADTEDAG